MLRPGPRYIVTKASDDGTFEVGDHIHLCKDGTILCVEATAWVAAEDTPMALNGVEVAIDQDWVKKRLDKLLGEMRMLTEDGVTNGNEN